MLKRLLPFLPLILGALIFVGSRVAGEHDFLHVGNSIPDWRERQRRYSQDARIGSLVEQVGIYTFLAGLVFLAIHPPKFSSPLIVARHHFPTPKQRLVVAVLSVISLSWAYVLATSGPDAASFSFRAEAMPWDDVHRDLVIFSLLAIALVSSVSVLLTGQSVQRVSAVVLLLIPAHILFAFVFWALDETHDWRWTYILRQAF